MKKSQRPLTMNDKRELQRGWTTGACATAAAKAAFIGLITQEIPSKIQINLPGGQIPIFTIADSRISHNQTMAAIMKDAGDDPDVTHRAIVRVTIKNANKLSFKAGPGVGTVTKPGLPIKIGDPAINPGPQKMIISNLQEIADKYQRDLNLNIEISVDGGLELAKKTWNPRLGIIGGISILGTTGIVIPYSCAAWIASIHQGIDVARATKIIHVAACTGRTSEEAVSQLYNFSPTAILDMGDFIGGTLKYLKTHPIRKFTVAGGFGKITKLAAGHMDLHSSRSQVDPKFIASIARSIDTPEHLCDKINNAESAGDILEIIKNNKLTLCDEIADLAKSVIQTNLGNDLIEIEIIIYDRHGIMVGREPF